MNTAFTTGYKNGILRISSSSFFIGSAGKKPNITDYNLDDISIRKSEKNVLFSIAGINPENIIMLKQVHGDNIIHIDSYPAESVSCYAEADGVITALRGLCLVIRTADCVPVFACDITRRILGAAHSGWRGCRLGVTGKLIEEMKRQFGSYPENIHAFILPSIGPESYTVNMDVAKYFPDEMSIKGDQIYINLWKSVNSSLLKAGLPPENIHNTEICNMKNSGEYFSHRKGDSGRNLNFGFLV